MHSSGKNTPNASVELETRCLEECLSCCFPYNERKCCQARLLMNNDLNFSLFLTQTILEYSVQVILTTYDSFMMLFCPFGAWWSLSLNGIELDFFLMEKNREPNRFRLTGMWVNGFIEWTNLLNPVLFHSWNCTFRSPVVESGNLQAEIFPLFVKSTNQVFSFFWSWHVWTCCFLVFLWLCLPMWTLIH